MSEVIPENSTTEETAKAQVGPAAQSSKAWLQEVSAAREYLKKFHKAGDEIYQKFIDFRTDSQEKQKNYNLFSVNVEILMSTLYAKFPQPLVTREWEDGDDDVARVAANVLERNLRVRDFDNFDAAMRECVKDRLVPGLAQVWFRYTPTIGKEMIPAPMGPDGQPAIDPTTGQPQEPQEVEKILHEEVETDYVHWKDFIWSPCRVWAECRWVGRDCKMNKADVEKRFGKAIADQLSYTKGNVGGETTQGDNAEDNANSVIEYAIITEIWCKRSRTIYWVCNGFDNILDSKQDPFGLENFWPCPKPWFGLQSTSSTVPRADYLMIRDQYEELNNLNNRIVKLESAVKVIMFYDKTQKELARVFSEQVDNQGIALDSFLQFSEKGGFKGTVDFFPLADIVAAIEKLRQYRVDVIQQIYELSGISDIMRGATKASETLGAQELKAQYGGVRLQMKQQDCALFVQEALEIRGRIMVKMFQPQTLLVRSNIMHTPDAQLGEQAVQLLKNQMSVFRVKVHSDSMAVPEFNAERDARLAYLRMIAEFLTAMAPLIQQEPGSAPYLLKLLQWGAASFRSGRTIEAVLDEMIAAATAEVQRKMSAPPAPPPLDVVAKTKKDESIALLNTAKAVGQGIENNALKEDPSSITETKADSKPPGDKPPAP